LGKDLTLEQVAAQKNSVAVVDSPNPSQAALLEEGLRDSQSNPTAGVLRLLLFFVIIVTLIFAMNAVINIGLRRIKTSDFGAENRMMQGQVNADIVITGSSRALRHYDPRLIQATTGLTAFNLGRNGSQTDVQLTVLKTYLEHNRKPRLVIHNLDAFSFVTTRQVFDPAQYVSYLSDPVLYENMRKINPNIWKSRYLPLYGYVVDDMNFTWVRGLEGFFGIYPRENYFSGFNPEARDWTDDFQKFKATNPHGVNFAIESAGVKDVEQLIQLCQQNGIQLIFVYSPEYSGMQPLTNDRAEIFARFHELADRYHVPLWDYSDWEHSGDQAYFYNSQHLNASGAEAFSFDLAARLHKYLASPLQSPFPGYRQGHLK
jgi:hypothetical protein